MCATQSITLFCVHFERPICYHSRWYAN